MNTNQSGNWKNPFENHISTPAKAEAKANESLKSMENEYLKDGLWYCKTCNKLSEEGLPLGTPP